MKKISTVVTKQSRNISQLETGRSDWIWETANSCYCVVG